MNIIPYRSLRRCPQIATSLWNYPKPIGARRRAVHRILKKLWNAFATDKYDDVNGLRDHEGQQALDIMQEVN